jgi:O-acetylhomoserine/O-acetylserine sulfhydrylase
MRAEWEEGLKENAMISIMGAASGQCANPIGNFDMASFLAGSGSKTDEGNGKGKAEGGKKKR